MHRLINFWYQKNHPLALLLWPFHLLLAILVYLRRSCYRMAILTPTKIEVPVIIVGNITLGGTGKSPLVIHLAERLSTAGYKVGILSRGYGGHSLSYPETVEKDSKSSVVGDEPLMIKHRLDCPVVADPNRVRGAKQLVEKHNCNLIICDDGLQHYALQRDIELLVIDGQRQLGNGLLMPFGPLRETKTRLKEVQALIINNPLQSDNSNSKNQFLMSLKPRHFVSVNDPAKILPIEDLLKICNQHEGNIDCVAAIGNPQRFFSSVRNLGFNSNEHQFNDHHPFSVEDFNDMKSIIIMTEKDAVKCSDFASENMWYLRVDAELTPSISQYCLELLNNDPSKH